MLIITAGKGFQMTFENGWTVSVQFGTGNYCENRYKGGAVYDMFDPYSHDVSSKDAECARWYGAHEDREGMEEPTGWQSPDEVAKFIAKTAKMDPVDQPAKITPNNDDDKE